MSASSEREVKICDCLSIETVIISDKEKKTTASSKMADTVLTVTRKTHRPEQGDFANCDCKLSEKNE